MAEVLYTAVVWTAGDTITEAKLDNMVANDRAVDAMNNGILMTERSAPSTPSTNQLFLYVKDKAGVSALYALNDAGTEFELGSDTLVFSFPITGKLVVGTNLTNVLIAPKALTINKAFAYVKTAPTGASLIIDINKNGSTIWSTQANRLTIAAAAQTGSQTSFDVTALAEGDILTLDIDQIGSTLPGEDLTVEIRTS